MRFTMVRVGFAAAIVAGVVVTGSPASAGAPAPTVTATSNHELPAQDHVGPMAYHSVGPFASQAACSVARLLDTWPFGKTECYSILTTPPGYRLWYYGRKIPDIEG